MAALPVLRLCTCLTKLCCRPDPPPLRSISKARVMTRKRESGHAVVADGREKLQDSHGILEFYQFFIVA